ncbi:MAG: ergothioneine biosynthesis protein EgtB [Sphingomonadaceae bacterium]
MATIAAATAEDAQLGERYRKLRALSVALAAPLSDADATIQPMPDASPAKWHLAHTAWFFETFVLRDHLPGYEIHDERWPFLFNSYYEGEGERHARPRRGMLSRPSLAEVLAYRRAVDEALLAVLDDLPERALALVEIGINHEEQHQELLLMDILAAFAENPLLPAVWDEPAPVSGAAAPPLGWVEGREGEVEIGAGAGFSFDAERPRHKVLLAPHALADRLVTNGEWAEFIADGGYGEATLWLSDGWDWLRENEVEAPLYWLRGEEGGWRRFGLSGVRPLDPAAPVCHISYYEADAFARWAGARLATEAEWESAAASLDPAAGNQLDAAGAVRTSPAEKGGGLKQMFGDVWEWTGSAFLPYPGFTPPKGTVGEYNGKFMCGQQVLKGASCATPRGHGRASYRNFYYPHQRWMFSGLRLAKDL